MSSDEDNEHFHYVCITCDGGSSIALKDVPSSPSLPTYDPYPRNALLSLQYRTGLAMEFSFTGATHMVDDVEFQEFSTDLGAYVSLAVLEFSDDNDLLESGLTWVPWESGCDSLEVTCTHTCVKNYLRGFLGRTPAAIRKASFTPWYAHGFHRRVEHSLRQILAGLKIGWCFPPVQFRFTDRSLIYTVETTSGKMFYKICPRGSAELEITSAVTECFPTNSFSIVAMDNDLRGILSRDFGFTLLDLCFEPDSPGPSEGYENEEVVASKVFTAWATLQKNSVHFIPQLRSSGVPEYGKDWMEKGLRDVYEYGNETQLRGFSEWPQLNKSLSFLWTTIQKWEESGIPATIVHGDLHSANISQPGGSQSDIVVFDWEGCYIGYPFLDMMEAAGRPMHKYTGHYFKCWEGMARVETIAELSARTMALHELVNAVTGIYTEFNDKDTRDMEVKEGMDRFIEHMDAFPSM